MTRLGSSEPLRFGPQDWLRCIEGPPGPGGLHINVVNLSSRLMARWDEPEAPLATRIQGPTTWPRGSWTWLNGDYLAGTQ